MIRNLFGAMLSDIMVGALLVLVLVSGYRAPILIRCVYSNPKQICRLWEREGALECVLIRVPPHDSTGRHLRQATTRDWQRLVILEQALQLAIDLLHLPLFLIVLGTGYYFLEMAVDMSAQVLYICFKYLCVYINKRDGYLTPGLCKGARGQLSASCVRY